LITGEPATVRWSLDGWKSSNDQELLESGLGCWFADLPATSLDPGMKIVFTFCRQGAWDGRNFTVEIM
jgi:glucoamylase